ncbi:uncharacterized protein LOC107473255 [Arachis duranensis]|uniref:Uncharacterized protein LOC107473255 n=1 Tax=Arachis duranensis TaxID=130453 RepID=A0A6P4CB64_ARADU|nr:uncharacterized protein LOC107473255 [Arachis duranensis]
MLTAAHRRSPPLSTLTAFTLTAAHRPCSGPFLFLRFAPQIRHEEVEASPFSSSAETEAFFTAAFFIFFAETKAIFLVISVEKLFYRIPISVLRDDVKYDSFVIRSNEDLEVLFYCRWQFPEVRTPELLAKLVDVVSNSGGSNWNPQAPATTAYSSSRPVDASSSVHVIAPHSMVVGSPSFAVDLNCSGDGEVGIIDTALVSLQGGIPDGIDEVLRDDDDDDDVEPNIIVDDSGDNIAASNPGEAGGVSNSETQQIQYKVVESEYRKYFGKCKKFGNGSTWLIRISLCQRRGIWEIERYNGPHTCLATSISSNHKSLDYHVISAFILPMVRADAAVCIKVLGVQMMMLGSVVVLRMSPVRVGRQVDQSQAYFHRLFWTFPPCIEAFRHCKMLVSIDGLGAIAQDENSNILPVAFALVEGENVESWSFFLSHHHQHVTPQSGILVISDWQNGIKAALEAPDGGWLPPATYRAFCIRHVATNFALNFKGKDARRLLVNAADAKIEVEFDYWFDILQTEDPAMCD